MFDLSPERIRTAVVTLIALILSVAVHEFGHAFTADRLGDRLPRSQGRVSLNPLVHADPIGTLLFPLLGFIFTGGKAFGFGWGRPVQVSPVSFTRKLRMRTGHMLVALAGPAMNVLLGTLVAVIHFVLLKTGVLTPASQLNAALWYAALPALAVRVSEPNWRRKPARTPSSARRQPNRPPPSSGGESPPWRKPRTRTVSRPSKRPTAWPRRSRR